MDEIQPQSGEQVEPQSEAVEPRAATPAPATQTWELSDLLSAVTLKELRQELRLKSFTVLFIAPQFLMFLVTLLQVASSGEVFVATSIVPLAFWATLTIPLIILVPRRAFFSFNKEMQASSLELLLLTGLSASKIVLGKWVALAGEAFLFLIAMSPYVMLQYFLGNPDMRSTLETIAGLFFASLVIIALGLNLSASSRGRKHWGLMLIVMIIVGKVLTGWYTSSSRWTGGGSVAYVALDGYLTALTLGPLGILLLLCGGASRIAPLTENYAVVKRILGLLVVGVAIGLQLIGLRNVELVAMVSILILIPVAASSLYEELHPELVRRWLARKQSWKFLTHPGWPGGVIYTILLTLLIVVLLARTQLLGTIHPLSFYLYIIGIILVPFAATMALPIVALRTVPAYMILQLTIGFTLVIFMTSRLDELGLSAVLQYLPHYSLIIALAPPGATPVQISPHACHLATALSVLIFGFAFRRMMRENQRAATFVG